MTARPLCWQEGGRRGVRKGRWCRIRSLQSEPLYTPSGFVFSVAKSRDGMEIELNPETHIAHGSSSLISTHCNSDTCLHADIIRNLCVFINPTQLVSYISQNAKLCYVLRVFPGLLSAPGKGWMIWHFMHILIFLYLDK